MKFTSCDPSTRSGHARGCLGKLRFPGTDQGRPSYKPYLKSGCRPKLTGAWLQDIGDVNGLEKLLVKFWREEEPVVANMSGGILSPKSVDSVQRANGARVLAGGDEGKRRGSGGEIWGRDGH